MRPDIDALVRFPIFADFSPRELSSVAGALTEHELAPGAMLFDEGQAGASCFFLHLGKIQIDRKSTPGDWELLAVLDAPSILGEMAILRQAPRSARAVAMRPCVLWEMPESALNQLANDGNPAAYKIMKWIARSLSDRLSKTNDKLIDIYAKPHKSMIELKQRLKELEPGIVNPGVDGPARK